MTGLTPTTKKYLVFISEKIQVSKMPPTIKELADEFGVAVPSAWKRVQSLKNNGFITVADRAVRGITLTQKGHDILQ